ncbi:MAG: hypothetical protein DPW16_07050 [Chloroflexi bacterium]|nr:hypothetical protein [Chloroflexota bacterium]
MSYRKKLIEVALPLEAINVASARENYIYKGNPSAIHKWWAQRPFAVTRSVIFASLVDDPDSPDALPAFVEACRELPYIGKNVHTNGDTPRMRLFDFIEELVKWESTTDERILGDARRLIQIATEGNPPPLLDPFAGGGSIPLEAQRLGLEAHASDLNPVAVMINKALIEIPPRFANRPPINPHDRETANNKTGTAGTAQWKGAAGLAADVRYYGEWMREKAWERIGHLYPTYNGETVIAWLWARTVKCPNPACGVQMPLVRSFELGKKKGRQAWAEPQVDPIAKIVHFEVHVGEGKASEGTVNRKGARCIVCGTPVPFEYVRVEGKAGRMHSQMMAIVTEGEGQRTYYSPEKLHVEIAQEATPDWKPDFPLPINPRDFKTPNYGMTSFADLFTLRQLVALTTFSDLVGEAHKKGYYEALAAGLPDDDTPLSNKGNGARAYAEAVTIYLTFICDKYAVYGCSLAPWYPKEDRPKMLFAQHAIPMVWDYAEVNPFSQIGGSFQRSTEIVTDSMINLPYQVKGFAYQEDARRLNSSRSNFLISTDPPYYDNIDYADLSDFFYVWMRQNLKTIFPSIFSTMLAPKDLELIASPYRFGGDKNAANSFFETGLQEVFTKLRQTVDPQFPLTIYYAFKQSETEGDSANDNPALIANKGWETILNSLIQSFFSIDGTWPTRTERGGRMISVGTNALASSIVLVCRPRPENAPTITRRQFVEALRRELPLALKEMQSGNIAPVDLAQASIGPGMAVYSRYSKVLEADGTPMSVRTALGLINQELDAYLAEQDGDIDADTRFAVAWFEQFGFKEGEFGQADVLARAKNTSVSGVEHAGVVESGRGKVKLRYWQEYDPGAWDPQQDRRPTVWEATHHLIERLSTHGETGAAMLMLRMSHDMAAEARNLAYRLYSICERKGWADHARDYNALVISWAGIGEEAARLRQAQATGQATEQLGLFGE